MAYRGCRAVCPVCTRECVDGKDGHGGGHMCRRTHLW